MNSNIPLPAAVAGAVIVLAALGGAPAGAAPAIPLNTGQETSGSNTGAHGFFSYTINGNQLCYTLSARNLSVQPFAAHIHKADRNSPGPIAIGLAVGSGTTWTNSACLTATSENDIDDLREIEAAPRDFYVNIHTATFPAGEIRGQLK